MRLVFILPVSVICHLIYCAVRGTVVIELVYFAYTAPVLIADECQSHQVKIQHSTNVACEVPRRGQAQRGLWIGQANRHKCGT